MSELFAALLGFLLGVVLVVSDDSFAVIKQSGDQLTTHYEKQLYVLTPAEAKTK